MLCCLLSDNMTHPYYHGTMMLLTPCHDATMIPTPQPAHFSLADTLRKLVCKFQVNPANGS